MNKYHEFYPNDSLVMSLKNHIYADKILPNKSCTNNIANKSCKRRGDSTHLIRKVLLKIFAVISKLDDLISKHFDVNKIKFRNIHSH